MKSGWSANGWHGVADTETEKLAQKLGHKYFRMSN